MNQGSLRQQRKTGQKTFFRRSKERFDADSTKAEPKQSPKTLQITEETSQTRATRFQRMRNMEAALFLSREPLSVRKLKQLADLNDINEMKTLIQMLNHYYDMTGRAFRAESVAGGYVLMTRPELVSWLRRLVPKQQQIRLSGPSMETLVVVAYRQPVVRAAIDAIRGVNSGEILRQLMDNDLVKISGRSEELGRPYLYSTTNRFLEYFGLNNLQELPKTVSVLEVPEERLDPDEQQE